MSRLIDVPGMLLSVAEPFDIDTKASSMKIFTWRCLNDDHPSDKDKEWKEMIRKRVGYRWCPECSFRSRDGGKCQKCDKRPIYNSLGEKQGAFCATHKLEGMVDVKNKSCEKNGCRKQPTYNLPGETERRFCATHKLKGMVDVRSKTCEKVGCGKQPSYNLPGNAMGRFCVTHKLEGMIDVISKTCEKVGCGKIPSYNLPGNAMGRFCVTHKLEGMINVISKTCEKIGCGKIPSYNLPGNAMGRFCVTHKLEGMINVRDKTCENVRCGKHPVYNLLGETRGRFCVTHKLEGMVNVKNKTCEKVGCRTLAGFGEPGHQPSRCAKHIAEGMVFKPTRRCISPKCKNYATYGTRDTRGEFCHLHAPSDYICLLRHECKTCGFPSIVDDHGFCVDCNPESEKRYRLAKQKQVVGWLSTNPDTSDFTSIDVVLDETAECKGSNKYRPDIAYRRDEGYYIIVEVDEKQHSSPSYRKCDVPRMLNLWGDIMAPTYFIRYNPDPYTKGDKILNPSDNNRKKTLQNWIGWVKNYAAEDKVRDGVHVVYLFYDDYDESKCEWETIDPEDYVEN